MAYSTGHYGLWLMALIFSILFHCSNVRTSWTVPYLKRRSRALTLDQRKTLFGRVCFFHTSSPCETTTTLPILSCVTTHGATPSHAHNSHLLKPYAYIFYSLWFTPHLLQYPHLLHFTCYTLTCYISHLSSAPLCTSTCQHLLLQTTKGTRPFL